MQDSFTKLIPLLRYELIKMSHFGKAAHLGSSLSCLDLIATIYFSHLSIDPTDPKSPERDIFLLSKGHAITSLYAVLAYRGFFPKEWLQTFNQNGSLLPEHPIPNSVPGVEVATGSLGHGLSLGAGIALGAHLRKSAKKIYVLLSDGECNEGSVWEAAMFIAKKRLNKVIAIIDYNKWQATDRSNEVLSLDPLADKWKAFGWHCQELDGHNLQEIDLALEKAKSNHLQPSVLIAHTVKGKGISFMEDDNNWHYRIPNEEEIELCKKELGLMREVLSSENIS